MMICIAFKMIAPYIPTNISSAIMPRPAGSSSSLRAGNGLTMSSSLNIRNADVSHMISLGRYRQVTHMPTNSSQTAVPGSGSDSVMSDPQAHIPMIVLIMIRINQTEILLIGNK